MNLQGGYPATQRPQHGRFYTQQQQPQHPPHSGGGGPEVGRKKKRNRSSATSEQQETETFSMLPMQGFGRFLPNSGGDAMMNTQETWTSFGGGGNRGFNASPASPENSTSGKHLLRAKESGQFSSIWSDDATCALVQQCVNLKGEFVPGESNAPIWAKVADYLNQVGYRVNRPENPTFSPDDCKKKWQYIYKEAKRYKRKAETQDAKRPKVIAILPPNVQEELLEMVGPVEPSTDETAKQPQASTSSKKKKKKRSRGINLDYTEHQYPSSNLQFAASASSDFEAMASNQRSQMKAPPSGRVSIDLSTEADELPSDADYAFYCKLQERKMTAIETILSAAKHHPEQKITLSKAIKLLESRTETVLKALEMSLVGSRLDVPTFSNFMRTILYADECQ